MDATARFGQATGEPATWAHAGDVTRYALQHAIVGDRAGSAPQPRVVLAARCTKRVGRSALCRALSLQAGSAIPSTATSLSLRSNGRYSPSHRAATQIRRSVRSGPPRVPGDAGLEARAQPRSDALRVAFLEASLANAHETECEHILAIPRPGRETSGGWDWGRTSKPRWQSKDCSLVAIASSRTE